MIFSSSCNRSPSHHAATTMPRLLFSLALLLMSCQYRLAIVTAHDGHDELLATIRLIAAARTDAEAPSRTLAITEAEADTSTAANTEKAPAHDTAVATAGTGTEHSLVGELALTVRKRQAGLMNRPLLDANTGMLFVFERPEQLSFWMKDTLVELSIAFLNRDGMILNIEQMKPLSLESVPSDGKAQYALEVNRGYFAAHTITAGTQITLADCPARSALLQHAPQKVVAAVLRLCQ